MENFIIKFIPDDCNQERIIHKVKMPDVSEKGFYRQTSSFNAFVSGKRSKVSKEDKKNKRDGCCWSPDGLYYCLNCIEEEWLEDNKRWITKYPYMEDETKFKTIYHESIFDFYEYIGFDKEKRRYKEKLCVLKI